MDTSIKAELTLEARDGRIRGALVQSNSAYRVELLQDDDGITVEAVNMNTGNRDEMGTGLTIEEAMGAAMHAMGALAHVSFPGFEPVQDQES